MNPEAIIKAIAINRVLRGLFLRVKALADRATDGAPAPEVRAEGEKLRRQLGAIQRDAIHTASLWKSKLQFVQSWGASAEAASAWPFVSALNAAALRDFIPHIADRVNNADATARPFAAAIAVALGGMDNRVRPMSPDHFADLLSLDDFERVHVNSKEAVKLLTAAEQATRQLATSGTINAQARMSMGLELKGLRPADQLTDEDAAYLKIEEDNEETDPAGRDDTANDPGSNSDGDGASEDDANDGGAPEALEQPGANAPGAGSPAAKENVGDLV